MIKQIILKNANDCNKFEHRLWLYKSIFFRGVIFKIVDKTNNDQYKLIEKALNIKDRHKRITYIFDTTCDYIDDYNNKNGISCDFDNCGLCGHFRNIKLTSRNGCCRVCPYQTDKGCPSKNIACKLFFCNYVVNKNKPLEKKDIKLLKLYGPKQRFMIDGHYFCKREMFLISLLSNSIVVYSFLSFYRFFKLLFFNIKKLIYNKIINFREEKYNV